MFSDFGEDQVMDAVEREEYNDFMQEKAAKEKIKIAQCQLAPRAQGRATMNTFGLLNGDSGVNLICPDMYWNGGK